MTKVAVIAAAGWKAAGDSSLKPDGCPDFLLPLEGCPNALLPIGGGETILSRLAGQLARLGFSLFVGVGRPGCLFPGWSRYRAELWDHMRGTISEEAVRLGREVSPWTGERIRYIARFATSVPVPDPDRNNVHDTFCRVLDAAGTHHDRTLMMHGDTLVRNSVLEKVLDQPCPCQYELEESHPIFWFNVLAAGAYRRYAEPLRSGWDGYPADVQIRACLASGGVPVVNHGSSDDWCDVDYPRSLPPTETVPHIMSYERALDWMRRNE